MPRAKTPRNNGNSIRQVLPAQGLNSVEANSAAVKVKKNGGSSDVEFEIRHRAYELYEQRGRTPGHDHEDWLVAEREVMARHNQQQSA